MIYQPIVAKGYEWVNACNDSDYEMFLSFDGSARKSVWEPIKVRTVRADDSQECKRSDFPWLGAHVLVLRQEALDQMKDIWDANGEVLPLSTDDKSQLYAFNAGIIDALDEPNSTVIKFPGTNRIMHIKKVAFVPNMIQDVDVFRLPYRSSSTYVSERFVERFKAAGLVGLDFDVVET